MPYSVKSFREVKGNDPNIVVGGKERGGMVEYRNKGSNSGARRTESELITEED